MHFLISFSHQILHLSLKVAQIVELQDKKDEAETNYAWTMKNLEEKRKNEPTDRDVKELWGLANNLYAK